jgi:hypothetical protein
MGGARVLGKMLDMSEPQHQRAVFELPDPAPPTAAGVRCPVVLLPSEFIRDQPPQLVTVPFFGHLLGVGYQFIAYAIEEVL